MRLTGWIVPLGLALTAPVVALAQAGTQAIVESASQPGEVKSFSNGVLTIAPYNAQSNVKEFKVESTTPILQGKGHITTLGLAAGTNVRIDYTVQPGQQAKATTVQVLPPDQVAAVKAAAQAAPPRMAQANIPPPTVNVPAPVLRPTPMTPAPVATNTLDPPQKDALIKTASGSQPGKVISSDGQTLVIDPYQQAAGNATLHLTPGTVIFQANSKVDTNALRPGTDVRVFYKKESGQKGPNVVAVELLNADDAQKLERSERNVPRGK
jgi:hypothetical protein